MKVYHWGQQVFLLLGMKGFCVLAPFLYSHLSRGHVTISWFSFYLSGLCSVGAGSRVAGCLLASLTHSHTYTGEPLRLNSLGPSIKDAYSLEGKL